MNSIIKVSPVNTSMYLSLKLVEQGSEITLSIPIMVFSNERKIENKYSIQK